MNVELDLRQVVIILWRKLWVIALFLAISGGIAFSISRWFMTPMYSASVSMYVYSDKKTDNITSSDLATSQKLVNTYIVILKSNAVLNRVSAELQGEYTTEEIRNMLSASSINNTEAFNITITHKDPRAAQTIANTVAEIAPSELIRVVKAGAVEVIDYAEIPDEPTSPHIAKNTIIGALFGAVVAAVLILLVASLDTVIRSEEDLNSAFNIPILGVIPRFDNENGGF